MKIEYTVHETRPHQRASPLNRDPIQTEVDRDRLAEELNKILSHTAAAHRKNIRHLSLKWRGASAGAPSEWATFP